MMFKKVSAVFLLVFCALLLLTSCGYPNIQNSSNSSSETEETSSVIPASDTDVSDDLDGLIQYLTSQQIISGDGLEMEADFIGAKKGQKFTHTFEENKSITVELYEYDPANLNEQAESLIASVKENGKFTLLQKEVDAYLSESGKYLMIYTDTKKEEANLTQKEKAIKLFQAFKK